MHGHAPKGRLSPTYRTWQSMIARCRHPSVNGYHRYGGRGIRVCERWLKFENFLTDMGERPCGKTIDRIDNDGDYEPSNCRWATPKEQAHGRLSRPRRFIVHDGHVLSARQWAKRLGLTVAGINYRAREGQCAADVLRPRYAPRSDLRG